MMAMVMTMAIQSNVPLSSPPNRNLFSITSLDIIATFLACSFVLDLIHPSYKPAFIYFGSRSRILKPVLAFTDPFFAKLSEQYIRWANPPTPLHKESAQIPRVPASELRDTHEYILKWSQMALVSQLQYRLNHQVDLPIATAGPVPAESFSPPTNCEITRVARCLYQLFLYLLYCECNIIYPKRGDQFNGRAILDDELEDIFACDQDVFNGMMVEAIDYLDLNIIHRPLLGFISQITKPALPKIGTPILPDAPRYYWKSHVQNAEWYIVAALGPQGLWKFLFESSFEEQEDICAIYVEAVIWDDWRLKEWGYLFPMIKLPLYLPGQTPFHRIDCELSTPLVPYRVRSKNRVHTAKLFPETIFPGWVTSLNNNDFISCTPLQVRDALGDKALALPKFTQPIKNPLPLEVQFLILKLADYSQYPTLRAVCKTWKAEAWRILKSRYTVHCILDSKTFREDEIDIQFLRSFVSASPSDCPFLIHSTSLDFTGYARGRLDHSINNQGFPFSPVVKFGKIYSKPDPDHPLVLSSTEHLRAAADYPVIIPNTESPQPLPHPVYMRFKLYRNGHDYGYSNSLAKEGETLNPSKIQTIKTFLGKYFIHFSTRGNLRSLPPDDRPLEQFRVGVALFSSLHNNPPRRIEITLTDPNIQKPTTGIDLFDFC
ncbi:hypothetical protein TWF751_010569 [Orbilia oligospora]|nr:hypothetical protein TWF751_010569 [Orbilia oligospora]